MLMEKRTWDLTNQQDRADFISLTTGGFWMEGMSKGSNPLTLSYENGLRSDTISINTITADLRGYDARRTMELDYVLEQDEENGVLVAINDDTPGLDPHEAKIEVSAVGRSGLSRQLRFYGSYEKLLVNGATPLQVMQIPGDSNVAVEYEISISDSWDISDTARAELVVTDLSDPYNPKSWTDAVTFNILRIDMIPDFNHDRKIDDADKSELAANGPFRFWINDDDDEGYDQGDDISLASGISQDWRDDSIIPGLGDYVVDGVRDLVDFFPVLLDVTNAVKVFPPDKFSYHLKHADGALNGLITTKLRGYTADADLKAGAYLTQTNVAAEFVASGVTLKQITAEGIEIHEDDLTDALTTGKGFVLLCEGRASTEKPLVLEIRKNADGSVVHATEMPLSLSGVEKMYRHLNLRNHGLLGLDGRATETNQPANYPDAACSNKDVVMLHGVNVGGEAARGWHSEMFRRLYWTGSRARFHGITYTADAGWTSANYQENVTNAFAASSNVNEYVESLPGSKVVIAHSMGNIVVCNAIQDYDMPVDKYFMLDAAVATEALDPLTFNYATNNNVMLSPDWREYAPRTWASKWHELFLPPVYTNDDRAKLTWKNRFAKVATLGTNVCNIYSSEDQALDIYTNAAGFFTGADLYLKWSLFPLGATLDGYVWHKQELFKGTDGFIFGVGSTDWAGWEFRRNFLGKVYSPTEANNTNTTPDSVLRATCVFRPNPADMFNSVIPRPKQNEILAKGIPALSEPVGHADLNIIDGPKNVNMAESDIKPAIAIWPRNHPTYKRRWMHSDIKDMAYLYVNKAFEVFVNDGDLK